MTSQSFLISGFDVGLERDMEPFLLPEKAFPTLEDVYIYRGRVERRFGFNLFDGGQLNSRLRMTIGTTNGIGGFAGIVPGVLPVPSPGRQIFSIGTEILTSNQTAGGIQPLISTGAGAGTLDNTLGNIVIAGAPINTTVYYYPGLPVMGLRTRETPTVNYEATVAFDTQFAYQRVGAGWEILGPVPPAVGSSLWTGGNADFYWTVNYRAANAYDNNFYVVNGIAANNIRYILEGAAVWTNFRPQLNTGGANRYLETCKILIPFKDRLVALNTIEDEKGVDRTYENRARWSQNGDPVAATAWNDDVIGRGGYIDAYTSESITSAQFVKDRLIVFFERSSWELIYTGNENLPFVWQQINTELGAESTFSEIAFDDGVISVGNRGIHIANSGGVQRIDQKILDQVGQINDLNNGPSRVYGIRDFGRELVMWTYPLFGADQTFPNKVLVYNYRNDTFAIFNDSFTCYGYYQKAVGLTWATLPYGSWANWTVPWGYGISQARYPLIIAGNQQGWTCLFEETTSNDPFLMVTDVVVATRTFTVPDHNLNTTQYIRFATMGGITGLANIYRIATTPTANTFTIDGTDAIGGVYTGGGTVEVLNNINIRTKNFPLFFNIDKQIHLDSLHFLLGKTIDGEITLDIYKNANTSTPLDTLVGSKVIRTRPEDNTTFEVTQDKIWHYSSREFLGESMQLEFTLSDTQMKTAAIQESNIVLHAILIKAFPEGRL